ncbi:hypothetical protein SAMN03097705_4591 [[Enterobacter] aerogenes]|nr:hypothetical protein SAMN03097705_4591 [[Enterobacter] aerogenes] [Klebsiella aerogenes]
MLHIMSPNMMIARTRPLQFQQGPFFIPRASVVARGQLRSGRGCFFRQ